MRIPGSLALGGIAGGIIVFAMLLGLFLDMPGRFQLGAHLGRLQEENAVLKQRFTELRGKADLLSEQMELLIEDDKRLLTLAGLGDVDPDTRMVGSGGSELSPKDDLSVLSEAVQDGIVSLEFDLDRLVRQAELERANFEKIELKLAENQELLNRTPSVLPVARGYVSSRFGRRIHPFTGRPHFHNGIDIAGQRGDPIFATADGTVAEIHYRDRYLGRYIVIKHGFGIETLYGHLSKIGVKKGHKVKRGDQIGKMGTSGRTTGPNVHYTIRRNGKAVNPRNFYFEEAGLKFFVEGADD